MIKTFQIHDRINIYLLDAIDENHFNDLAALSRGRSVDKQWAHMHNAPLMWLHGAAPTITEALSRFRNGLVR